LADGDAGGPDLAERRKAEKDVCRREREKGARPSYAAKKKGRPMEILEKKKKDPCPRSVGGGEKKKKKET